MLNQQLYLNEIIWEYGCNCGFGWGGGLCPSFLSTLELYHPLIVPFVSLLNLIVYDVQLFW